MGLYGGNPLASNNSSATGVYSNGKHVGSTLSNAIIAKGGYVEVYTGGTISNTQINNGSVTVESAGVMNDTVVRGGAVSVGEGGTASKTQISAKGKIVVCNGGTASNTTLEELDSAIIRSGGYMSLLDVAGGSVVVSEGGIIANARLNNGAKISIAAGASAYYINIGNSCSLALSRNVTEVGTVVNGGGKLYILTGASANGISVNGTAFVESSAVVNGADVDGKMYAYTGATVGGANVSGVLYAYSSAVVSGLALTGSLYAYTGARVSNATIIGAGRAYISSRANVYDADVIYGGRMYLSGGAVASTVNVNGGILYVSNGATVNDLTVRNYPHYEYYTVSGNTSSRMVLTPNGTAYVGGKVTNATVISGGKLYVSSGAVVNSLTVSGSASATVSAGAKLTGLMHFGSTISQVVVSGGTTTVFLTPAVKVARGAEINFDLRNVVPNKLNPLSVPYRVTGANYISDISAPNYTITVAAQPYVGSYRLMDKWFSIDTTVTVGTSAKTLAVITLDKQKKSFTYGAFKYTLNRSGSLDIASRAIVSGVKADITKVTRSAVTVTADFSVYAKSKQYSVNNGKWQSYSKPVKMKTNGTVYFRALDEYGNASDIVSYKVANIDLTAPDAPKVKLSTTRPTNRNVTVTATFSKDSSKKQYSTDKKNWKTYSSAISAAQNGTYHFRAIDEAGNISKVTTAKVANIDKVAPKAPTVKPSTTKPTNQSVTVKASFSGDTAVRGYSFDKKTWAVYGGPVTMKNNGTVYFRGVDEAGNVSKIASYTVKNIDRTAPDAPKAKASTTKITNQNVTVSATFSKDTRKRQYSLDNRSWKNYSSAVTVKTNGTVYFRGIDEAGNISKVTSIKIANIDKTAPDAPTVKLSTTKPTNRDVTVTASFSKDSVLGGYSFDRKNWKICTGKVTMKTNGTVYFRAIDAAGNVSKITTVKVANIDKTAPDTPTVKLSSTKAAQSVTVTASFAKDVDKKQYSTDNKTWKTYSKALTVKANGTYYFRGADAAGNVSKVASVKVKNIVDTSNNSWADATKLTGSVLAALENSADKVDYYDVGDVAKLMLDMEAGKAKVSFFDSGRKAVKTAVDCADGSAKNLSSLTLVSGDKVNDNITLSDLGDVVKYLRIESAADGMGSYRLAKLA